VKFSVSTVGIVVSVAIFLNACAGDGTGLDANGLPTDTTGGDPQPAGPTLSNDVQPIFSSNCALSGCHGGTSPQQNQNLSTGLTFSNVVDVPSMEVPSLARIRPGQPDSSYLVHKISGTQASVGGVGGRMPLGGAPLSATEIQTIRQWVENGALDN